MNISLIMSGSEIMDKFTYRAGKIHQVHYFEAIFIMLDILEQQKSLKTFGNLFWGGN